jgi:hypothetical protein
MGSCSGRPPTLNHLTFGDLSSLFRDRADDHTDHRTLPLYQTASGKLTGKREQPVPASRGHRPQARRAAAYAAATASQNLSARSPS